jgi:hypothetical protein
VKNGQLTENPLLVYYPRIFVWEQTIIKNNSISLYTLILECTDALKNTHSSHNIVEIRWLENNSRTTNSSPTLLIPFIVMIVSLSTIVYLLIRKKAKKRTQIT